MARTTNPPVVEHMYLQVFGRTEHPQPIEVANATESARLQLVARWRGFTLSIHPEAEGLAIPGVAYRHVEGPVPLVEYGLVWLATSRAPFSQPFVAEARRVLETWSDARQGEGEPVASGVGPPSHAGRAE